ncbi:hypothetical protein G3465_15210 [Shewanella baltica]|uniref:crAss001_48 related protein n=1 Tax=Shewanella baltica TaxID=62322 RepID=UPI00217EDCAB|nr:hypothetical protein [Shewanella baltica]MCS6154241.1 hypothetical protein [Shewanella baltica]
MQEIIQKLKDEHTELSEKLKKLWLFISSDASRNIGTDQRRALGEQAKAMKEYKRALEWRIRDLGGE